MSLRRLVPLVLCLGAACVQSPAFLRPAPERAWPGTLRDAQAAVEVGRFAAADSTLARFAEAYPSSDEASEALFWRALFRLDPANQEASPREAAATFTRYLAREGDLDHAAEARALRRAAILTDSILTVAGRRTAAASAEASSDKDKDAEIQRLREDLKKATDELERIKRRLSTPTTPP